MTSKTCTPGCTLKKANVPSKREYVSCSPAFNEMRVMFTGVSSGRSNVPLMVAVLGVAEALHGVCWWRARGRLNSVSFSGHKKVLSKQQLTYQATNSASKSNKGRCIVAVDLLIMRNDALASIRCDIEQNHPRAPSLITSPIFRSTFGGLWPTR